MAVALMLALFAAGIWIYRVQTQGVRVEVARELSAIAGLKAAQITDWYADQLEDGASLMRHPYLVDAVARFLAAPDAASRRDLRRHLASLAEQHAFSDIRLVDLESRERLRLGAATVDHASWLNSIMKRALAERRVVFVDLHRDTPGETAHSAVVVPLYDAAGQGNDPLGCLLLVSDGAGFLFPQLHAWPLPSRSAETLLVRRDGESVLFLANTRHRPGAAFTLREPLSQTELVTVLAVQGRQGYVHGRDYRGAEVEAVVLPIPATPWFLVAKIDTAEAFADGRARILLLLGLLAALAALGGSGALIAWQRRQRTHDRVLLEAAAETRAVLEHRAVILQAIGDGVVATDAAGRVTLVNAAAETLTGWSAAAAEGQPLDRVLALEDSRTGAPVASPVQEVLASRATVTLANHTTLVARDGQRRHIADSAAPILAPDGELLGAVLVFRDVSEGYALRETVRRERLLLGLFVDQAPAAIAMFDREMRYLAVSRRYLADYGLGERDIIGTSHYEVFPEIPERWREVHRRCLQGSIERCEEDQFLRQDGRREWVRWAMYPWYETADTIGGAVLFTEVVTERKVMEEALRQSEAKFRTLFQQHAAVKLLIDPEDGRILEANEAAAAFYGWSREELERMRIDEINTLSPEQIREEMARVRRHERIHFEFRHRRADGSVRDVAVYSSAIDIQGKSVLHSIIYDITEFRQMEEQLRQARKMESIGLLAGGVAHEFNNMLAVILGYTQLGLERIATDDPLHADLQEIQRAAEHSARITSQLLAFARRQPIQPRVFDLNTAIPDLLALLTRLIGERIRLVWQPGPGELPVRMDPAQLDQVLINLCLNSRDAITGAGTITIATGLGPCTCEICAGASPGPGAERVLLTVRDTGCGMDEATRERIFEPFFTTKAPGKGTGLGLPTVYGIVHQHGGCIEVTSTPGEGTTVTLALPLAEREEEPAAAAEPVPALAAAGATVLLVEDEPSLLQLVRLMLAELGYRVLAAASAPEALQLAREQQGAIDLLVTDLVLPGTGGRELADTLQAELPGLRVLCMSGHALHAAGARGGGERPLFFLQKPFRLEELARAVQEALAGSAAGERP
jgi:PAS domain S-box-containing protein